MILALFSRVSIFIITVRCITSASIIVLTKENLLQWSSGKSDSDPDLQEGYRSPSDCGNATSSDSWRHSNSFSRLLRTYNQIPATLSVWFLWFDCLYHDKLKRKSKVC